MGLCGWAGCGAVWLGLWGCGAVGLAARFSGVIAPCSQGPRSVQSSAHVPRDLCGLARSSARKQHKILLFLSPSQLPKHLERSEAYLSIGSSYNKPATNASIRPAAPAVCVSRCLGEHKECSVQHVQLRKSSREGPAFRFWKG